MNEKDLQLATQEFGVDNEQMMGLSETDISGILSNVGEGSQGRIKVLNKIISNLSATDHTARNRAELVQKVALASPKWFKGDTRFQDLAQKLMRTGTDADIVAEDLLRLLREMVTQLAKQYNTQTPVQKELKEPVAVEESNPAAVTIGEQEQKKAKEDLILWADKLARGSEAVLQIANMFLTQEQKANYTDRFREVETTISKVKEIITKIDPGLRYDFDESSAPKPVTEALIKETLIKSKIRGFLSEELGKLMSVPAISDGPEIQEEDSELEIEEETLEEKEELK